ncbi:hypothetical protein SEA_STARPLATINUM_270 [Streptomyces phage StarPlatinum]|uniref:Uncharacterized protein n=1 Tax=Streptomyces phage StarPlatinum TaxID=2283265 RepID=A0A345M902_9CAUD|nr:hypothetical protein HWB77_gp063 [Streptomyces phage StarPlatinum]AXH66973.1 hypothetical protein SEA_STARPLATINUM_270 [Streptomyces phage StarPlatinum]
MRSQCSYAAGLVESAGWSGESAGYLDVETIVIVGKPTIHR